jgi:exodeoxyribonuclease V gamma subunit
MPDHDAWQRHELRRILAEITTDAGATPTSLTLSDVRALLAHRLEGRPTRANFRTGNLTVCTLVPMRSVPHRVVCLLGLDDGVFPRKSPRDGDDLLLENPHVGDRDPRAEDRQLLLDALLAARDKLLITFSGNDERTNARVPPAVPVGELLDAIDATAVAADDGRSARDAVLTRHPLQSFDARNFTAGTLRDGTAWGFDRSDLEGARALANARRPPRPFLPEPLPAPAERRLSLEELVQFAERPIRAFLRQRLGIAVSDFDDEVRDALPVELDGLERWAIGQRLLDGMLAGADAGACIRAEIARGTLPPRQLGFPVIEQKIWPPLSHIAAAARQYTEAEPESVGITVALTGERTLIGSVSGIRDHILLTATYSRLNARHRIAAWVRLVALVAASPEPPFEAVTIGRAPYGSDRAVAVSRITIPETDPAARRSAAIGLLEGLVELRDRGLREPLPLPPLTAAAYAGAVRTGGDGDMAARGEWASGFNFDREDVDPDHQRVFGGVLAYEELAALSFGTDAIGLWSGLLDTETLDEL